MLWLESFKGFLIHSYNKLVLLPDPNKSFKGYKKIIKQSCWNTVFNISPVLVPSLSDCCASLSTPLIVQHPAFSTRSLITNHRSILGDWQEFTTSLLQLNFSPLFRVFVCPLLVVVCASEQSNWFKNWSSSTTRKTTNESSRTTQTQTSSARHWANTAQRRDKDPV